MKIKSRSNVPSFLPLSIITQEVNTRRIKITTDDLGGSDNLFFWNYR